MEDKREEHELFCAVLCTTVVHNDTYAHEQFLKISVGLGSGLVSMRSCRFIIVWVFFWLSLVYFVLLSWMLAYALFMSRVQGSRTRPVNKV